MTRGRNPRKLHFQINEKWHEVVAYQKILCPAEDVEKATKVYRANPDERRILQNWLALGYRRQAFNSATDAMVRKLQLSSIVKKCEKDLVGIWLDCIHSSEKADTTQYYDIYSVFFADSDFHCHTEMIEGRIVKVIEDGWDITPFVISDDDFSYREAMTFTYINFDYFSTENIIDR